MPAPDRRSESPTRYSQEEPAQAEEERTNLIPENEPPLNPNRPMHAETRAAFNQPPPSRLSRAGLIVGILVLLWIASKLGQWGQPIKPQVIYANRYSDEHKYRPAASPVITETLADGRIRLRGANIAGVGIQPTDLPKTPAQIAQERKEKEAQALEDAKVKLGLKKKRDKEKEARLRREKMEREGKRQGGEARQAPGGGLAGKMNGGGMGGGMGGKMGAKRGPGGRGGRYGGL